MFLILVPKLATSLELRLMELIEVERAQSFIAQVVQGLFQKKIFLKSFANLPLSEVKLLLYSQATEFRMTFEEVVASQEQKFDFEFELELTRVLETLTTHILKIVPNNKGIEDAMGDARREFRANAWWLGEGFRPLSEQVLLEMEKLTNNMIPAYLYHLSRSLEMVIQEVQELNASGVTNLVFWDDKFVEMTLMTDLRAAVATLKLERSSGEAILRFSRKAPLLARRKAQEEAEEITRVGFVRADSTRVGMGSSLEVYESEYW